jgi:hypothetical protein
MMTNYDVGVFKTIPMKTHLTIDTVSSILLAASPWIFGFADRVYMRHLILDLLELGAVMMTKITPATH